MNIFRSQGPHPQHQQQHLRQTSSSVQKNSAPMPYPQKSQNYIDFNKKQGNQQQSSSQVLLLQDSSSDATMGMLGSNINLGIVELSTVQLLANSSAGAMTPDLATIQSQIFQTLAAGDLRAPDTIKSSQAQTKAHTSKNTRQNTKALNTPQMSQNPKQFLTLRDPHSFNQIQFVTQEQEEDAYEYQQDQQQEIQTERGLKKPNADSEVMEDQQFVERYLAALKLSQEELANEAHRHKRRLITCEDQLKLRPNLKRKIKQVVSDPSEVSMKVYHTIISFDGRLFKKFVQLSKGMRKHIIFHFFENANSIVKDFNRKYGQLLFVESRYLSFASLSFNSEAGSKLELTLKVKVKTEAKKIQNKSVSISHGYRFEASFDKTLTESRLQGDYQTVYQFDLFPSSSQRWFWLHKDECLFHGLTDARAYSMPVMPICVGDQMEISITLLSLMGALDVNSIKWQSLKVEPLPHQDDVRDYNRFKNLTPERDTHQQYFADLRRVCEVEDAVVEWFTPPNVRTHSLRSHVKRRFDTSQFQEQFEVLNVEVGGVDFSVWRVQLRATPQPTAEYVFYPELNMGVTNRGSAAVKPGILNSIFYSNTSQRGTCKCVPQSCCQCSEQKIISKQQGVICNEVKRTGFLIDSGKDVEVRPGDIMVVYISMGGFEK